jgi:hypothetical protein
MSKGDVVHPLALVFKICVGVENHVMEEGRGGFGAS